MIGCRAGLVHLVAQLVAVDPDCTQSLQSPGDGALPTAAASCQADYIWKGREMGCVLKSKRERVQEIRKKMIK